MDLAFVNIHLLPKFVVLRIHVCFLLENEMLIAWPLSVIILLFSKGRILNDLPGFEFSFSVKGL